MPKSTKFLKTKFTLNDDNNKERKTSGSKTRWKSNTFDEMKVVKTNLKAKKMKIIIMIIIIINNPIPKNFLISQLF